MVYMQFFGADMQFFMADMQFFIGDMQFFAAGLLLPYKLCFYFLLDSFCYVFVSCLPLTEHVQSLSWACADIIDPICYRFG